MQQSQGNPAQRPCAAASTLPPNNGMNIKKVCALPPRNAVAPRRAMPAAAEQVPTLGSHGDPPRINDFPEWMDGAPIDFSGPN
jgi:hypothetical protein